MYVEVQPVSASTKPPVESFMASLPNANKLSKNIAPSSTLQDWEQWTNWKKIFDEKPKTANSEHVIKSAWKTWQKNHPTAWLHFPEASERPFDDTWTLVVQRDHGVYWENRANGDLRCIEPGLSKYTPEELRNLRVILSQSIDQVEAQLKQIKTKAASRSLKSLEMIRRDFLRYEEADYNIDQQIEKFESLIDTVGKTIDYLQFQYDAEATRKKDHYSPMTFINIDGTCWLHSVLQVLLAMKDIRDIAHRSATKYSSQSIVDANSRKAFSRILDERDAGEPVTFAWDLLHSLGSTFKHCNGNDVFNGMARMFQIMPYLREYVQIVRSADGEIGQAEGNLRHAPYIFVIRDESVYSSDPDKGAILDCPDIKTITVNGESRQYKRFAAIEGRPSHAIAKVLVGKFWYELDDHKATRIVTPVDRAVNDGSTRLIAYKRI